VKERERETAAKKFNQSEDMQVSCLYPGNQDHIAVVTLARVLIHKRKLTG
jgi:hypothetical protein